MQWRSWQLLCIRVAGQRKPEQYTHFGTLIREGAATGVVAAGSGSSSMDRSLRGLYLLIKPCMGQILLISYQVSGPVVPTGQGGIRGRRPDQAQVPAMTRRLCRKVLTGPIGAASPF